MFDITYRESDNMQLETSINPAYGYIYKITNMFNGKLYIGKTTNLTERISKYNSLHCKSQYKLYNALKKYGVSNFSFHIILEGSSEDQLNVYEKEFIRKHNSIKDGYNLREGGEGGKHSEETKHKMSLGRMGILNPMYGKPLDSDHRIKISKGLCKTPIFQYTLNGAFIKEWESSAHAARSLGYNNYGAAWRIILNAKGKPDNKGFIPKSVFGYVWSTSSVSTSSASPSFHSTLGK